VASETEVTYWAAELAKSGEVRVRPRREVTALTALIYGVVLTNEIRAVVSATLGHQDWRWWPLFCLVAAPALIPLIWWHARMALFGRPVLVVDNDGVSLGRKRLNWETVKTVEGPNSARRSTLDPRRPVDASREWFGLVTVVPVMQHRRQPISVGKNHVRDLEGLAAWLEALRRQQQTGSRGL
jgi:hypothetical protein